MDKTMDKFIRDQVYITVNRSFVRCGGVNLGSGMYIFTVLHGGHGCEGFNGAVPGEVYFTGDYGLFPMTKLPPDLTENISGMSVISKPNSRDKNLANAFECGFATGRKCTVASVRSLLKQIEGN